VPLTGEWKQLVKADIKTGTAELLRRISKAIEELRANPPRSARPARPETTRQAANQ